MNFRKKTTFVILKQILIYLFLITFGYSLNAQNFIRTNEWKKYRKEVYAGFGAANFLGDLGGLNKIGTDYSPVDLEFSETRTAFQLGYRYKLAKWFNFSTQFNYLIVRGDDKLTTEQFRNNRNLNFKSNIFELSGRMEFVYMSNRVGHRYGIKRTLSSRMKNRSWDFTVFMGIGGFYFNPKGRTQQGQWVKLRGLHTEGQGLPNGPKQYGNYSICIPMGMSYRIYFNRKICVGIEVNFRKTFTDYIDDVSGVYYDKNAIKAVYGSQAAYFADPSKGLIAGQTNPENNITGSEAQVRGDSKQKDAYMSLQLTVGYIIKQKRHNRRLRSKF
jgi:hypothetical protein